MDGETAKININTIARMAKVSTTTVSSFINGTEVFPISRETRYRVKRAMLELNYRPHIGGVLMRRNAQRHSKVGFVFGEDCRLPVLGVTANPLIQRFLCNLESVLDSRLNMSLEILRVNNEDARDDWNSRLLELDCLINFGQLNNLMCDTLFRRNLPLIEVYSAGEVRRHGDFSGIDTEFDFLFWRNDNQIEQLFEYFYSMGKRKFLFISSCNIKALRPEFYGYDAEMKLVGFKRALSSHPDCSGQILSLKNVNDFNMFREFELTRELLQADHKALNNAEAVICHNDIVAQGVASIAREFGRRPGYDLLLSGEGHFRELQYWYPKITTSWVDYAQLSDRICELIELRLRDKISPPRKIEIPTLLLKAEQ